MSMQGVAVSRFGDRGRLWHTRRISWDGFKDVHITDTDIAGLAFASWDPEWTPVRVDLRTGYVSGGSDNGPEMTFEPAT